MDTFVYLKCVLEGSRMRVKIISPGYFNDANCQFPRNLREENRYFKVPSRSVNLAQTGRGTYFYRVNARSDITILDAPPANEELRSPTKVKPAKNAKTKTPVIPSDFKVYEPTDQPECVICMDVEKQVILVPCGHYCLCKDCANEVKSSGSSFEKSKCPMCRTKIESIITPSQLQ